MASTVFFSAPVLAGRFRLLRRLGAGGMGEVWAAEQIATGRQVAVKLLAASGVAEAEAAARFEIEARSLCRVAHPHVVRVIDFGRDPTRGSFLATELLAGETLGARLDRAGRLPPAQVMHLAAQILAGLQAVHEAGIVHRDLKPANVMLVPDGGVASVRLLDFGVAKLLDPAHRVELTTTGTIFGTPAYISPEQALGRQVDARADLYACGVILYRALAGRLPFEAESPTALAIQHAKEPLPPLPEDVPEPIRMVIEQALEKDPDDRFESAAEMAAVLSATWPESEPLQAPAVDPPEIPAPAPADGITEATPGPALEPTPGPALEPTPGPGRAFAAVHSGGVSRTVLALRLSAPTHFAWAPPEKLGEPRTLRLTPPLVARDVVESFGGKIAEISNEGLVAEFVSPTDTLQCAAALHDRLAELGPVHGFAADARVAVAAGEVARAGRALRGEPVRQAELLAAAAAAGEVLFTHGVYLAMTRSEVECEPWPGRDPGVGQKLYRLCAPADAPRAELPFGGATLERTQALTPRRVAFEAGRVAGLGAQMALRAGMALHPAMRRAAEPVVALARKRRLPVSIIVALALIVGGGAALALVGRGPAGSVERALEKGNVEEAARLASEWLEKAPSDAEAHAWRARALATAGRLDEADAELRKALEAEPALARVEGVARAVVRTLDRKGADRSLVMRHRSAAMDRALLDATHSIRYWERWNAVRALEKLGKGDLVDRVEVYLLDLQHAGSCGTRIRAARELAKLGDPRAIEVLLRVRGTREPDWACNLDGVIDDAVVDLGGVPPAD